MVGVSEMARKRVFVYDYEPEESPPDFSYTMTARDIIANGVDADIVQETMMKRTELETEIRRDRFKFVEMIPRKELMDYIINIWLFPREIRRDDRAVVLHEVQGNHRR